MKLLTSIVVADLMRMVALTDDQARDAARWLVEVASLPDVETIAARLTLIADELRSVTAPGSPPPEGPC